MSTYSLRVDDATDPPTAAVAGELDRTNVAAFADDLIAVPGSRPVILDMSELRYIDSTGFGTVMQLVERHLVVIVLAPVSLLRRAASVMGLPFHEHVEAARMALRGG